MSERSLKVLRMMGIIIVVALVGVALFLGSRMGGVDVAINEAAYAPQVKNPDPGPIEFTVCTYNVQARPWFDETKLKFGGISPLLNQFDIIGIQECFKDHERLWKNAGHPVKIYHSRLKHPFKIVGSGLSILGSYPLVETNAINYDALGEFQNKPASKGVLMARFKVGETLLDFYTTHIEAGGSPEAMLAKEGQGNEIIAFVNKLSPPENNVIFLGDFNMRPSRGPEDKENNKNNARVFVFDRIVEQLNFRDASDEFNGPVGTEIDRILFRPGAGCFMDVVHWQHDAPEFHHEDGKPMSDHDPVFVRFRMGKQTDANEKNPSNTDTIQPAS